MLNRAVQKSLIKEQRTDKAHKARCTAWWNHSLSNSMVQTQHKAIMCSAQWSTDTTQSYVRCTKRPFSIKQTRHKAMCTARRGHSASNRHDTKLRALHEEAIQHQTDTTQSYVHCMKRPFSIKQTRHKATCTAWRGHSASNRHDTKLRALHEEAIQHQTDTTQSYVHCTKRPFSIKQTRHKAMCTAQWSHSVSNSTTETWHKTISIAWWSLLHKSTGQLACLHKVQDLFFFLSFFFQKKGLLFLCVFYCLMLLCWYWSLSSVWCAFHEKTVTAGKHKAGWHAALCTECWRWAQLPVALQTAGPEYRDWPVIQNSCVSTAQTERTSCLPRSTVSRNWKDHLLTGICKP